MPDDAPTAPSRDATVTAHCLCCQRPIPTGRGRLYCTARCRQAAYRRRHTTATPPLALPVTSRRRDTSVYICPECDTRTVGRQRCEDCNIFTQRLGTGGHCPHCEEPVTIEELLQMPLDNT